MAVVAAVAGVLDRRDPRGFIDVLVADGKDIVGNADAAVVLLEKAVDAVELLAMVVTGGKAAVVLVPDDGRGEKMMGADVVAALLKGLNRSEGTDPAVVVLLVLVGKANDGCAVDELNKVLVVAAVVVLWPGKANDPMALTLKAISSTRSKTKVDASPSPS